jgi:hypothetical protein
VKRRDLLKLTARIGALAAPRIARAEKSRALRFVPIAGVSILDPVWIQARPTRNQAGPRSIPSRRRFGEATDRKPGAAPARSRSPRRKMACSFRNTYFHFRDAMYEIGVYALRLLDKFDPLEAPENLFPQNNQLHLS